MGSKQIKVQIKKKYFERVVDIERKRQRENDREREKSLHTKTERKKKCRAEIGEL